MNQIYKIQKKIVFCVLFVAFVNCYGVKNPSIEKGLDIEKYLSYANSEIITPSEKQIRMLEKVMPKQNFQPAPKITNRGFWNPIAITTSGKSYLNKANSYRNSLPEVPISDSIYRIANRDGNRGIYKPRYYRTMEKLEHFILAECIENKGRFIPQVEAFSRAIISMKSWLHPNHDDNDNGVLEGRRVSIDLGARKFGAVLALANSLLADKLSNELKVKIEENLKKRITNSYLKSTTFIDEIDNKWLRSTSNWNSVCTSGSVLTIITSSKNYQERLLAVGAAINSMKYYLSGFGDDGYCSEGLGYWGYGFNHYLYLAQILYDYTGGKIDLFRAHDPVKMNNVGNFPENFEIQLGRCSPFADGVSKISSKGSNFARIFSAKHYGAVMPSEIRMEEAAEQLVAWKNPEMFKPNTNKKATELPNYTYYEDFGMVISRGKQKVPFSIAVKAGHNKENHNHSDVGTYTLVLGKDIMAGDIGAPSYRAGSFSPKNKARSSWGHPVPMINETLQSNGYEFKGTITKTNFAADKDVIEIDVKAAYELPVLKSLTRTVVNDKTGNGKIIIKDVFEANEKIDFNVPIMTLNEYEIINDHTIIITSKHQKVKVEVLSKGFKISIEDELVPVKHLREGAPAYRIGIQAEKKCENGILTIVYTPM